MCRFACKNSGPCTPLRGRHPSQAPALTPRQCRKIICEKIIRIDATDEWHCVASHLFFKVSGGGPGVYGKFGNTRRFQSSNAGKMTAGTVSSVVPIQIYFCARTI